MTTSLQQNAKQAAEQTAEFTSANYSPFASYSSEQSLSVIHLLANKEGVFVLPHANKVRILRTENGLVWAQNWAVDTNNQYYLLKNAKLNNRAIRVRYSDDAEENLDIVSADTFTNIALSAIANETADTVNAADTAGAANNNHVALTNQLNHTEANASATSSTSSSSTMPIVLGVAGLVGVGGVIAVASGGKSGKDDKGNKDSQGNNGDNKQALTNAKEKAAEKKVKEEKKALENDLKGDLESNDAKAIDDKIKKNQGNVEKIDAIVETLSQAINQPNASLEKLAMIGATIASNGQALPSDSIAKIIPDEATKEDVITAMRIKSFDKELALLKQRIDEINQSNSQGNNARIKSSAESMMMFISMPKPPADERNTDTVVLAPLNAEHTKQLAQTYLFLRIDKEFSKLSEEELNQALAKSSLSKEQKAQAWKIVDQLQNKYDFAPEQQQIMQIKHAATQKQTDTFRQNVQNAQRKKTNKENLLESIAKSAKQNLFKKLLDQYEKYGNKLNAKLLASINEDIDTKINVGKYGRKEFVPSLTWKVWNTLSIENKNKLIDAGVKDPNAKELMDARSMFLSLIKFSEDKNMLSKGIVAAINNRIQNGAREDWEHLQADYKNKLMNAGVKDPNVAELDKANSIDEIFDLLIKHTRYAYKTTSIPKELLLSQALIHAIDKKLVTSNGEKAWEKLESKYKDKLKEVGVKNFGTNDEMKFKYSNDLLDKLNSILDKKHSFDQAKFEVLIADYLANSQNFLVSENKSISSQQNGIEQFHLEIQKKLEEVSSKFHDNPQASLAFVKIINQNNFDQLFGEKKLFKKDLADLVFAQAMVAINAGAINNLSEKITHFYKDSSQLKQAYSKSIISNLYKLFKLTDYKQENSKRSLYSEMDYQKSLEAFFENLKVFAEKYFDNEVSVDLSVSSEQSIKPKAAKINKDTLIKIVQEEHELAVTLIEVFKDSMNAPREFFGNEKHHLFSDNDWTKIWSSKTSPDSKENLTGNDYESEVNQKMYGSQLQSKALSKSLLKSPLLAQMQIMFTQNKKENGQLFVDSKKLFKPEVNANGNSENNAAPLSVNLLKTVDEFAGNLFQY